MASTSAGPGVDPNGSRNCRMGCFLYSILLAVIAPGMRQRHATLINYFMMSIQSNVI